MERLMLFAACSRLAAEIQPEYKKHKIIYVVCLSNSFSRISSASSDFLVWKYIFLLDRWKFVGDNLARLWIERISLQDSSDSFK